jgi:ribosomal protein L7Ae-like RNA K-turn-binding protein
MSNALGILGIAKKAGLLEIGEEQSGIAARGKKARALLTASDAADNTQRRITNFAERAQIPHLVLPYTKEELGDALGLNPCAAVAVTDAGMAANIAEKLEAERPGLYTEARDTLKVKSKKILQRKKEALAHEKNLRKGKHASSEQKGRITND